MYGNADTLTMLVKERHAELLREVERDRLGKIARDTATSYGERRTDLRVRETGASMLDRLVERLKGAAGPVKSRPLTGEPAV